MKIPKVTKIIFQDDNRLCLVVCVSVISFLVVSSVVILNILNIKQLSEDVDELKIEVASQKEIIRMLKDLVDLKNIQNIREKRNARYDEVEIEDPSQTSSPVTTTRNGKNHKMNPNKKHRHNKKKHHSQELARLEQSTENTDVNLDPTEVTVNVTRPKNHRKHHRHHQKKHHHQKDHNMETMENSTSQLNPGIHTTFRATTQENMMTLTDPEHLPTTLNSSQSGTNIKQITKRSYELYDRSENSPEFSTYTDEGIVLDTQSREVRSRNTYVPSRSARRKPQLSIHLNGDTSKYKLGVHENFRGNGHLRHPSIRYVDWVPSSWVRQTGMHNHFEFSDGYLTIKESGIYFVYAQVHYYDEHDENAFRVYKNNQWFLQCTAAAHSVRQQLKGSSCYTAATEYLHENDRIHLADVGRDRYSIFETGKSFFGVIKI